MLLSPALCLEFDNGSYLTAGSLFIVSYASVRSVRQAGSATATVEREQLIGHARHENCDTHTRTLSMTWQDLPVDGRARLYSLQKCAKHLMHLRISSKRVIARFATRKPANWHEKQIEIRSKTLLIPQTVRTRAELVAYSCQLRCTVLWSSHARTTLGRTITGCVHSHEINRLQHCLWVCSYTLALTPDSVVTYDIT